MQPSSGGTNRWPAPSARATSWTHAKLCRRHRAAHPPTTPQVGEERFTAVRTRLRATSERAADEMLAAEAGKLRAMMGAPGANLDAIEAELRR